jgi:hypothetical protein
MANSNPATSGASHYRAAVVLRAIKDCILGAFPIHVLIRLFLAGPALSQRTFKVAVRSGKCLGQKTLYLAGNWIVEWRA